MGIDEAPHFDRIDGLIEAGEEYMERRRWEMGIDDDLIKKAGLSSEHVDALQWHQGYSGTLTEEQKEHLKTAVERLLTFVRVQTLAIEGLQGKLQGEQGTRRRGRIVGLVLSAVVLCLVAVTTFSSVHIAVEPDGPAVLAVESSWWGLKEHKRTIRWTQPSGYYAPAWMTKNMKGEWYPYIMEDPWSEGD